MRDESKRWMVRSCVALTVPAALIIGGGQAFAGFDPNGPYTYDCGTSRSATFHIEAYAPSIQVVVNNERGRSVRDFRDSAVVDIPVGVKGSVTVYGSGKKDGIFFSPNTRVDCTAQP